MSGFAAVKVVKVILVKISFLKNTQREKPMNIENNEACFVRLWLRLERTRRLLGGQYKRFCIRNVLKAWFGSEAGDELIWQVCRLCEQEGYNELLGISFYRIDLKALDRAYSEAFPRSTPINKSKAAKPRFKVL